MTDSKKTFTALLAGNPNVGKSTVFNALTGLKQHTGNWAGKTVLTAVGTFQFDNHQFILTDLPGTYSLNANSPDEVAAQNAIIHNNPDCVIIVVDASCLERNLNLVLQILEITHKAVLCVNLIDEAYKKHIVIDFDELSLQLGIPVVPTAARSKKGLDELMKTAYQVADNQIKTFSVKTHYDTALENATALIQKHLPINQNKAYFLSLKLLNQQNRQSILKQFSIAVTDELQNAFQEADKITAAYNISDSLFQSIVSRSEHIFQLCVSVNDKNYSRHDRKIDHILTSKITGIPIMLLLFALIFYLTIIGANYPSEWLHNGFSYLYTLFGKIPFPPFLKGILLDGIFLTVTNVISVMLPPMAIFFPLFTLLEDLGYLPRVAFNLDRCFCKVGSNGKNSLTMLMGFGCNACGVTSCRIIESPRERHLAILTNNFSPCNGRFPTLIAIISIFLVGNLPVAMQSFSCAIILTGIILFSMVISFIVSKILSSTLLKGEPQPFILELPPFRKPQIFKTIVRSLFDRTIFILGRAIIVAAPAGAVIWLLANIDINGQSFIQLCTQLIDPFARFMGLDGVILFAFLLGFPANEIVLPIALMIYMSNGVMTEYDSLTQLQSVLSANHWTIITAICTMLFTIMHFPCSTACITIYKETKSLKYTLLAFAIPTICGMLCCILVNFIGNFFVDF